MPQKWKIRVTEFTGAMMDHGIPSARQLAYVANIAPGTAQSIVRGEPVLAMTAIKAMRAFPNCKQDIRDLFEAVED